MTHLVHLMRGLPASGKSHTAKQLAGEFGVILETDAYFYSEVGDDPTRYDYRSELLEAARQWNFQRFQQSLRERRTPIVVDRGNGFNAETQRYASLAVTEGYRVELTEPDSPWWQEIRVLLRDKSANRERLEAYARELTRLNRQTHRTPYETIRRWMFSWKPNLTVQEILDGDFSNS